MDVERTQARLANAQTVEPMLGALRTISLGTWQAALSRLDGLKDITSEYQYILHVLAPVLKEKNRKSSRNENHGEENGCKRSVLVLAGTERGLCGRLDQDLIEYVKGTYPDGKIPEESDVLVIGGRLGKAVKKQLVKPSRILASSSTAMPAYPEVFELTKKWIHQIGTGELKQVEIYYQAFHGATHHEAAMIKLLPHELDLEQIDNLVRWPPPIIETDPRHLFVRVYEQMAATRFYDALLQTKASIHSARFQLMEDSTKNAERLIEDLTVILQTERRQNITREMQELAVGAGLLKD